MMKANSDLINQDRQKVVTNMNRRDSSTVEQRRSMNRGAGVESFWMTEWTVVTVRIRKRRVSVFLSRLPVNTALLSRLLLLGNAICLIYCASLYKDRFVLSQGKGVTIRCGKTCLCSDAWSAYTITLVKQSRELNSLLLMHHGARAAKLVINCINRLHLWHLDM